MQLEGERPMQFFCKMNKKRLAKAQFEELHVKEVNENGRDSVEIIKYKHTGYFKFARANSFAEAYKKIVGWITRYNDELCQLCHMTSDSDDDE